MEIRAGKFPETIGALVVGVSRCADPNLDELAAVKGETQHVGDLLVSPNACRIPSSQVSCLISPEETTREQILVALRQRAGNAQPGDILFFYFAGHGIEHAESFALVPSNGVATRRETLITAADLGQSLAGTRARGIFMVIDCCGGAAIYENARALFRDIEGRLEFRILLSSSKQGESSWEIRGRGSPFTVALIEALQGQMPGIGDQGQIYFTSLMAHVISRVEELLEHEYSDLPPQHPNFDGSYQKDPLLFVNSDIAIGRLVLKTARYSPEYVRRRVRLAIGGLVTALAMMLIGYWTWLDQHFFFRMEYENVTLYHGYPNFPWPGMPRRLWQPGIYRALLNPDSALAKGGSVILEKDRDIPRVFAKLDPFLTTTGKVYMAWQANQPDRARQIAKAALDANDPTVNPAEMLRFYAELAELGNDDKAMLAKIIRSDKTGAKAAVAFPALLRVDPDQALQAIKESQVSLDPDVLYGLSLFEAPCSDKARSFLYFHLLESEQPNLAEFGINAAVQAHCKEPALPFFARGSSRAKTFGYFSLLQSNAYRRRFATRVLKSIKDLADAGWQKKEEAGWTGEAIEQLAFSGTGPCDMNLIDYTMQAAPNHRLDIFEYLLNSCSGLSYEIVPQDGGNAAVVILQDGGELKAKVLMDFDENEKFRDRMLDFVQRRDKIADNGSLIDEPIASYIGAWKELQATKRDQQKALNALKWAVQLKYWSTTIGLLLGEPKQPVSIRKWALFAALRTAPTSGTKMLIDRYDDFAFDFDGFVKMIVAADLPADSIKIIRQRAGQGGEHNIFNVILSTLYGTSKEVVALLLSIDASDRATAWTFAAFRDDLPQIVTAVRQTTSVFDPGIADRLEKLSTDSMKLRMWLANIPDWALDWRVFVAGRLYGPLTGFSLRHLAEINSRKKRGIERPFDNVLLQFSSWQ